MTVLIADDSAPVRKSLRRMLEAIPAVTLVLEAVDGLEAVELIISRNPKVLILDLLMQGKTGFEVLHDAALDLSETTVIMLTNYADREHREESIRLGANYFFDKSTEFEKIPDVLKELR